MGSGQAEGSKERHEAIRAVFLTQADACEKLGSPFTGRVCGLLAQHLDPAGKIGAVVFGWQSDASPSGDSVPLRLCGALNHLVITGADAGLASVYPPVTDRADDALLWQEIDRALDQHAGPIGEFIKSAPQTNEVRRSAVLLAGWSWLSRQYGMPLVVSEVGASAGLNLFASKFLLTTEDFKRGDSNSPVVLPTDWRGDIPPLAEIAVADRRGCDLAPIDAGIAGERARLLSYVWPDQRDRVERTIAAIDIATGMRGDDNGPLDKADAADWLEVRLSEPFPGHLHVVQHTIAWQYFPEAVKTRGETALAEAGAKATDDRPLARLSLEADGGQPGAAIMLTLWPGGTTHSLGRADYHGRWVDWRNPAV